MGKNSYVLQVFCAWNQALYLEIELLCYKAKTLKPQLLKKLSLQIYEIQDLSSPNRKPKLLLYD